MGEMKNKEDILGSVKNDVGEPKGVARMVAELKRRDIEREKMKAKESNNANTTERKTGGLSRTKDKGKIWGSW